MRVRLAQRRLLAYRYQRIVAGSLPCDVSVRINVSTPDQLLYSAPPGTAMRYAAERRNLDESIEELRKIADSRNDVLAEAAGITAGFWYASPATHVGYERAGMLILAGGDRGPLMDYDKPERWTRIGLSEEPRHGGDQR